MPLSNIVDTIIHADCYEVLRGLGDKSVDLVLTDPPYGIDVGSMQMGKGAKVNEFAPFKWDSCKPTDDLMAQIWRVSKNQIVWGGNYFNVPPSRCWLSWDKCQVFSGADFELAYTSFDRPCRCFRLSRVEAYGSTERYHPTQKPLPLFSWCLSLFSKPGDVVLDPFAGSGTTALACHALGRHFICIERELEYVNVARNRLRDAQMQLSMFGGRENGTCGGSENSAQQAKGEMAESQVELEL